MRRLLTLLCLFGLALPAGISISGCTRNPAANYCNGEGYGLKVTDVAAITLQPQIAGISLAYGQTQQVSTPTATTCKGTTVGINASSYSYGTTNNQLVDISPSGNICAGTWNRNTGGGIADYTYCYYPDPLPSTGGLPYSIAYITATADSVTSNPVAVYVHAPITAVSLVGPTSCLSQSQTAQLDALAYYSDNGTQSLICQPAATATITGYSVISGVATLTASNSFVAGERVTFSGLSSATFLNGLTSTVLSTGLSNAQFEVAATASDAGFTVDSGTATTTTSNPTCGSSIGTFSFSVGTSAVATINATTNVITAEQPGTTAIIATLAETASSAGYFSTCPPESISMTLANGSTKGVVTQGATQNLTTTITDTLGNSITGLALTYQSTNPIDISVSSGAITASYPGAASINAVCEPPSCNPAPINEIGLFGTGLPLSSNPVSIIVPGTASDYVWFAAPGQSQYFYSMQLLTGNPGSVVRLPYVPNSMVMDRLGNNLYFGSLYELIIYSTSTNSIIKQNANVPGVVLAVSPNNSYVLINDQTRDVFYIYNVSAGTTTSFSGLGAAAAWTPDSSTLYIADSAALGGNHTNTMYVYNNNTGWSTYDLSVSDGAQSLAITIPSVGAYLAGPLSIVAHTWCPSGTVGNNASMLFYPQSDAVNLQTSVLGATTDGAHILGAVPNGSSINLSDIGVTIPATVCTGVGASAPAQGGTLSSLSTSPTIISNSVSLNAGTNVDVSAVDQVVAGTEPTTASVTTAAPIAFITYNASSTATAQLPYYLPLSTGSVGSVGYVTFNYPSTVTATATAPLAGAFSPDNSIFFVSTAGDNEIHFISIPANVSATAPTDSQQISPDLPACTPVSGGGSDNGCLYPTTPSAGTYVPATVIAVKPRSVT